jgi:Mn-dependent transcriptional regulator
MAETLTPSLEDYLETILKLCDEYGTAKISDIAKRLTIAKPSVTQAVALLRREGFVNQVPYGPISLTEKGRIQAQDVWHRHQVISRFLCEILKVQPATAEKDACMIEHVISPETVSRMADWLKGEDPAAFIPAAIMSLDSLVPGQKARIIKVQGKNSLIKHRILEMGLVPDVEVEIERVAPLGDPIELKTQDFHLSLRREEAVLLLVEVIHD